MRRVLTGLSPLAGDRLHLHHLLQDHGLSTRQTLLVLSALAIFGGAVGLFGHFAGISDGLMFALFAMLGMAYFLGLRRLAKSTAIMSAAATSLHGRYDISSIAEQMVLSLTHDAEKTRAA